MPKSSPVRVSALADLKKVKKEMALQAERAALAAKLEAQAAAQRAKEAQLRASQSNLFQAAIGKVKPLLHASRAQLKGTAPAPIPKQQMLDDEAAVRESVSDEVDITSLLDTDADLSYRRPGVGPDVPQKLRRGVWSIQAQVDLHGLRSDDARETLGKFIRTAHKQGIRCIRVVHGKGLGSPGKAPVLKDKVRRWLVQKAEVLCFVQAPPMQGGKGALLVLLQPMGV
ncbi:MAG: DNA mismatch repair protein MutS [Burkholderiales bacterium PBB4]|nr:MAG: DNA mismatch repair protein MutS [Burkholderiales bacterium PBB4]